MSRNKETNYTTQATLLHSSMVKFQDDCGTQYVYFIDQVNVAGKKAIAPMYAFEVQECWVNIEPEEFDDITRSRLVTLPDHEFGSERQWVCYTIEEANMIVRDPDAFFDKEV